MHVATAPDISGSILGALAGHEAELLAKVEAAKAEAREIVERARNEARGILQKADAVLTEEVGGIRRAAQDAREQSFRATLDAAEAKLSGAREQAMRRVPQVADEVVELFMPGDIVSRESAQ